MTTAPVSSNLAGLQTPAPLADAAILAANLARMAEAWPGEDYRRSGPGGYAAQVTETAQRLTGRPARSLDDLRGEIAPTIPAT